MIGQWIGKYSGDTDGEIVVNIEKNEGKYEVLAYLTPTSDNLPLSAALILTDEIINYKVYDATVSPIHPSNYSIVDWEAIRHLYPEDVIHSKTASVRFSIEDGRLIIDANTDVDIKL